MKAARDMRDSKTFVIEKADASVSITWNDGTYNTNPHPASAVVDGVGGETDLSPAADLTYYAGSDATSTPLPGAPTNAGTYTVDGNNLKCHLDVSWNQAWSGTDIQRHVTFEGKKLILTAEAHKSYVDGNLITGIMTFEKTP